MQTGPKFVHVFRAMSDFFCDVCCIHFTTEETLHKHQAAIHKTGPLAVPCSAKRARSPEAASDGADRLPSENIELEPILGVLSDAQKDGLLLRAVQRDSSFYELIIEQATLPLTEDAADARVEVLGPDGVESAVRWYIECGAAVNALTMLFAASQRTRLALEDLGELLPAGAGSSAAGERGEEGGWQESEELGALEALPSVGALAKMWVDAMTNAKVRSAILADADGYEPTRGVLEGMQAAAAAVRGVAPAVLVGPEGQKAEQLADAMRLLDEACGVTGAGGPLPPKSGKEGGKKKARTT